ncbi:MAG: ATP-binding cassette domain-containing protein [Acidimicrobiia bacterium]|nr:ATP-binding cassette domain-containing protein [Acidimicrobiia bacterium]
MWVARRCRWSPWPWPSEGTVSLDVEAPIPARDGPIPARDTPLPERTTPIPARDEPLEPLLAAHDLSYAYLERFTALDGVSLRVERGEKVALLGANGCGKSTLLKILDGLLFPDSGRYCAFGVEVTEAHLEDEQFNRGFRSRMGFVFQNSDAQVFSPTVREEVAFGPLNMGMGRDEVEARVADTVAMLGIADLAERAPFQLSGGEKKKVAIASVLAMNPEVLLFDEPTAALDPRTQEWLVELILELSGAGKTVVLATHDLDVLERLADRCLVFSEDHRIVAEGAPGGVLDRRDLLLAVNLIHEHGHRHGALAHAHEHGLDHHAG